MTAQKVEMQIIDNDSVGIKQLKVFLNQDHVEAALAKALPKHLTAERFISVALTTISRTPELANCSTLSLYGGIIQASQLGLELDGVLGHAYLVPFKQVATLMIGFKGLRALAIRSGQVKSIRSNTVFTNDLFEFSEGVPDYFLKHRPQLSDRGDLIAAYSIAMFPDGGYQFVVMGKEEIEKVRKSSKMAEGPTWKHWYGEMAKKTADRRLCKQLQQSPELSKLHSAVNIEEAAIGGNQDLSSLAAVSGARDLARVETSTGTLSIAHVKESPDQSNPKDDAKTQAELKEMADRLELESERKKKAEKKEKAVAKKAAKEKKIADAERKLQEAKDAEVEGAEEPPEQEGDPGAAGKEAAPAEKAPTEAPLADQKITERQKADLLILASNEGWSEDEVTKTFKKQFLCESLEDLTKGQYHAAQRLLMTGELEVKEDGE
jgi:phage RecT family recombinase